MLKTINLRLSKKLKHFSLFAAALTLYFNYANAQVEKEKDVKEWLKMIMEDVFNTKN